MADLSTSYMGLSLKNPLIASASIIQLAEKGIGAVVLKSLFEEQILNEINLSIQLGSGQFGNNEDEKYISEFVRRNNLQSYLDLIKGAKAAVKIPIIASISCITADEWITFAKKIEKAGADGLEINAYILPTNRKTTSADIEFRYLDTLTEVRKSVKIPVALKIGNSFTNLVGLIDKFKAHGAAAVVLFNRYYEPNIDIETLEMTTSAIYSSSDDIRHSLRWVGIIADKVRNIDIAASTGIHDGGALIKQLLAGATVGQICSTLYLNGFGQIDEILETLEAFMEKWNFNKISDFRGRLSYSRLTDPAIYERAQFMKYFSAI